jgi:2-phospho-L-lactate/phosphoenolpyruvate guanylyltransferase
MSDIGIVPLKNLSEAKKRLTEHLSPDERKKLVLAMLDDVLRALGRSKVFSETYVISPDKSTEGRVRRHGALFLKQRGAGLNAAIQQALRELARKRASSVTIVLADLPLASPADFRKLERISNESPRVVLAPSLKGGTNVMVRSPSNVIKTSYGRWSYAKHLRAAQRERVPAYSISNYRLSFDVDTIQDLRTLLKTDRSGLTHAGRTARHFRVFNE